MTPGPNLVQGPPLHLGLVKGAQWVVLCGGQPQRALTLAHFGHNFTGVALLWWPQQPNSHAPSGVPRF